jgi:hypothetical protein
VTAEAAEAEGKSCSEAGGFEAEDEDETGNAAGAVGLGGGEDEEPGEEEVGGEDVARFDGFEGHKAAGYETVEGVETLGCGEDIGWQKLVGLWMRRFRNIQLVDADLPASSQKLTK